MSFDYTGGVPDWCGEAANRQRLEAWSACFGPGGIPCPVCDLSKLRLDFRKLSQHFAAGKEKVTLKPPAAGKPPRAWKINLLSSPAAVIGGRPSQGLEIVHLQLSCSQCHNVQLFDAQAIGLAI